MINNINNIPMLDRMTSDKDSYKKEEYYKGYPNIDFLYLNEEDMIAAGVKDMAGCVEAMEEMFKLMKIGDYRMGGANAA